MSDAMLLLGGFIGLACILLAWTGGYYFGKSKGEENARIDVKQWRNTVNKMNERMTEDRQ